MKSFGSASGKYTIGETAKRFLVTVDTLRFYEKKGLITPNSKTVSGYRLYTEHDMRRIHFIKQAQSWGLTLSDIKELVNLLEERNSDGESITKLLMEKKHRIETKLTALHVMLHELNNLIDYCASGGKLGPDCPVMNALEGFLDDKNKN